ncbi:hypothetical protein [Methanomassiliicoccus luminyensis]|uniref:hypothetical protein n=1 Tax=Methanomassiliicoccus luminyensis TaxID=1080712 RepID=UPI000673E213|nr:hypothetical protein [Methanomassiliicoccus luminyensis]
MVIVRPRLNDYFDLPFTQDEVDFAIPYLDEDIPLFLDPFLLWKSPAQQDNALHTLIINSFNRLGFLANTGKESEAIQLIVELSECNEVGLGNSKSRKGKPVSRNVATEIISVFKDVAEIKQNGFLHIEEIQLYVDQIAKDRISDISCNYLKSFLIDYTIQSSKKYNIPLVKTKITYYDIKTNRMTTEDVNLPSNPERGDTVLLVPKRWLRISPWINLNDYIGSYFKDADGKFDGRDDRSWILTYNRKNFDAVRSYIAQKEQRFADCKNDPLFNPLPVTSIMRKLKTIERLSSGKVDNSDKKYEDNICQLMATLFYPYLDFAKEQSRTDSNVLIRDLIFYNNRSMDFLEELKEKYDCRQIVFELKNVKNLEREHINQLNRYLSDQFGRFGVIITRNPPPTNIKKNIIDLWSGQRKCILVLTDNDVKFMCSIYKSKQRLAIELLKGKYIEFTRDLPS